MLNDNEVANAKANEDARKLAEKTTANTQNFYSEESMREEELDRDAEYGIERDAEQDYQRKMEISEEEEHLSKERESLRERELVSEVEYAAAQIEVYSESEYLKLSEKDYRAIELINLGQREDLSADEFNAQYAPLPPMAFESGEDERKRLEDQFIYDQLAFSEVSSDIYLDKIVNTLERDAIQNEFSKNRDEINNKFDAQIKDLASGIDAKTEAMDSHLANYTELYLSARESEIKLKKLVEDNLVREHELTKIQSNLGSSHDLADKLYVAEDRAYESSKEADSAKKSLVQLYEKQIEQTRAPLAAESNVAKTGWRAKLADGLSAMGAERLSDKVRGTDESKLRDQSYQKDFYNRQQDIRHAADGFKTTNPALSDRLKAQADFERTSYAIKNLKEATLVGLDSAAVKEKISALSETRTVQAVAMAEADKNFIIKGNVFVELNKIDPGYLKKSTVDYIKDGEKINNGILAINAEKTAADRVIDIKEKVGLVNDAVSQFNESSHQVESALVNTNKVHLEASREGNLIDSLEKSIGADQRAIKNIEAEKALPPGFKEMQERILIVNAAKISAEDRLAAHKERTDELKKSYKV